MNALLSHLRAMVAAMPPGASVSLPVDWLRAQLEESTATDLSANPEPRADLTVEDVARIIGRKESTIRGWLGTERIPGAYRFQGREWRVPRAALERFLEEQRKGSGERPSTRGRALGRSRPVDLGAWRQVRQGSGGR